MVLITYRGKCMATITKGGRVQSLKVSYILCEERYYLKGWLDNANTRETTHTHKSIADRDKMECLKPIQMKIEKEKNGLDNKENKWKDNRLNPKLINSYIKSKWSKHSN